MGDTFHAIATDGPLLLAVAVAALAGLVSFLSPCVLPLVPGYLSYMTGLAGADLDAALGTPRSAPVPDAAAVAGGVSVQAAPAATISVAAGKRRMLAGSLLFVVGFTAVFTIMVAVAAQVGVALFSHKQAINVVGGVLIIVFGLAFLGVIPGLQREARIHRLPAAGLLGAPVFGAVFAVSWTPCLGPTLGAVTTLGATVGGTGRAVTLAVAYGLGLGLPFVVFGLAFRQLIGVFRVVRRHSRWVTRIGGVMLVIVGLALVTGGWDGFLVWLRTTLNFDAGVLL
jgi:cytochrome c-type biogenesis protein